MKQSTVSILVRQAIAITTEQFAANGVKKTAASAGWNIIARAHVERRNKLTSRLAARFVLAEVGQLELDGDLGNKFIEQLMAYRKDAEVMEAGFNGFLAQAWGWRSRELDQLAAFSWKFDDVWQSTNDEATIREMVKAITPDEWFKRGFWEALRWVIENHPGAQVVNDSEFFKFKELGDVYRIPGQLSWWSSFKSKAAQLFIRSEEQLADMEEEYKLSGGCNTHYVGEMQERWEAASKRLEKAVEAEALFNHSDVQALFEVIDHIFELAERDAPRQDVYSEEKEFVKQLQSMETAAAQAIAAVETMLAKSAA